MQSLGSWVFSAKIPENQKVIQQTFFICIIQSTTVHIIFRFPAHVIKLSFFGCSKSFGLNAMKRMLVVVCSNAIQSRTSVVFFSYCFSIISNTSLKPACSELAVILIGEPYLL